MKHLIIALASLGLTNVLAASVPQPMPEPVLPFPDLMYDRTLVSVPQFPGGFFVGVTGYYLQPSSTNNDLDFVRITSPTASRYIGIDPGYNWGGGVNAGIIFPGTGNDIEARYFHLETDDTNSALLPLSIFSTENFFSPVNFAPGLYRDARGTALFNINQVDAVGGQYVNVGSLQLHPVAGMRWADVNRKLRQVYSGVLTTVEQVLNNSSFINEKSDFDGVGPLAGVDFNYSLVQGLGIVGHFDSALLLGDVDVDTRIMFNNIVDGLVSTIGLASTSSVTKVIPALDEKLGLSYTLNFNSATNLSLSLEVGYQASQYFNVVDRTFNTNRFAPFNVTDDVVTSHVALNGGYVNLTLTV